MGISKVIMIIMAVFFALGAIDRLIGNKFGLGGEFERAFGLMGPTSLSAIGFMVLAPVIANVLDGVLAPVFGLIGADTGMFPGILLSCEVAYPLAAELAADPDVALFGGLVVGSVMGFIIGFTIPVALSLCWFIQGIVSMVMDIFLTKHYRKIYDAEDAIRLQKAIERDKEEAEKERIRAERRSANPDGITENTSKKKLQAQQQRQAQEQRAAAAKEYAAKKGIVEEIVEEKPVMSGIASRPYCKGRAYDPNRYANTEE